MSDAYSAAGVDVDSANKAIERYKNIVQNRADPRVLRGLGGFSGCFALQGLREPVLVASTDGVGTKVLIAAALGRYDTIGQDLVNHCVNDVLCNNADPLFFLDYLAMGRLDPDAAATIVAGISRACERNGVALLGGETAEMPGVYSPPAFDLAGTIVGALERSALLDLSAVEAGDAIIGLPANGLHTNGYSLARKVLPQNRWLEKVGPESELSISDALLAIHPSYLRYVRAVQAAGFALKSMAHVTGGGLIDNLPRALPGHLAARLQPANWRVPPIAACIVELARLDRQQAHRTFNMGIGFCFIVDAAQAQAALHAARSALADAPIPGAERQTAVLIGEVEPRQAGGSSVIIA